MRNLLDDCLEKTRKIKDIEEEIEELRERAMSPKSQTITGMPRGSTGANQSDSYIVKLERKEARQKRLIRERDELWEEATKALDAKEVKREYVILLHYRFFKGLPWKKCCTMMCKKDPDGNWNMNKVFRVYRQILRKLAIDEKAIL